MTERVGVFICECGPNIKDAMDISELVRFAGQLETVVLAETIGMLCTPQGREIAADAIRDKNLSHVVIAGCSPREHESTFQALLETSGRNPFMLQTVNLREQCAWVIQDLEQATRKAKRLIRGAVQRVKHHRPIVVREIDCRTDILVIGAGVAGISAARTLAQNDRRVFVVERSPCIGGMAARYEDLYPDFNCAACLLGPDIDEILHDEGIEVFTSSEVTTLRGRQGNFTVSIRQAARRVDPSRCIGCAACFDVCPVIVPNEFNAALDTRKAIHIPYPGSLPHAAVIDATHCLRCNGQSCSACKDACPCDAVDHDAVDAIRELMVGAVVVATGFSEFDPGRNDQYGDGVAENVISTLTFERLVNTSGPTRGKIVTAEGRYPKSVAFVHCVGSRTEAYNRYCSGVCCLNALKQARQVRNQLPETVVHHFFADLCLPGKTAQRFADQVLQMDGVVLHRLNRPDGIRIHARNGRVRLAYSDAGGIDACIDVQLAVLATAMEPSSGTARLARILAVDLDADGFFKEAHPVTDSVAATREGIFLAGCCQGPADIPSSMARGQAAAGRILQKLIPGGKIPLEPIVAEVNPDVCSGCRTCEALCAFGAICPDDDGDWMTVEETLCRGCGVCVAACPAGAVDLRHYSRKALLAEIDGLLKPEHE